MHVFPRGWAVVNVWWWKIGGSAKSQQRNASCKDKKDYFGVIRGLLDGPIKRKQPLNLSLKFRTVSIVWVI